MASLLNDTVSTLSPNSTSTDDSEDSFVVLCQSTIEHDNLTSMDSTLNSIFSNETLTAKYFDELTMSTMSEPPPKYLNGKLENLLRENLELKDTLHQNNLAMKKQFDTLVMWQEEVKKVHESHKEKFEETKKLIGNLRTENDFLKQALSSSSDSSISEEKLSLTSKISTLEHELLTLREANIKYKNDHSKQITELQTSLNFREKSLKTDLNHLQDELKTTVLTLAEKTAKIDTLTQQNDALVAKIASSDSKKSLNEIKMHLKQIQEELITKNRMLAEKDERINLLTCQINNFPSQIKSDETKNKLKQLQDELNTKNRIITENNVRIDSLTLQIDNSFPQNTADEHKKFSSNLKSELEKLQSELDANNRMLTEKDERINSLTEKLNGYRTQIESDITKKTLADLKRDFNQLQEELNTKNLMVIEKGERIEALTRQIREFKEKVDSIPILQMQLDQYKTDFLSEHSAYKELESEKIKISEDLRHLMKRNEDLLGEVEALKVGKDFVQVQVSRGEEGSAGRLQQQRETSPPTQTYDCPVCGVQFRSYRLIAEHAENCGC